MLRSRLLTLAGSIPRRNRCIPHHHLTFPVKMRLAMEFSSILKEPAEVDESFDQLSTSWPSSKCWCAHNLTKPLSPSAAVLAIAGVGLFIKYNDEKRAIPKGSYQGSSSEMNINKPAIGGPFKLYDMENHVVTDHDLRGNWTLMYFGYTSSPDVDPEEVRKMVKATDILESVHSFKLKPVFITIDPQRDTPDQLWTYLKEFDSRIVGLTGPISTVRQIAQEYRVYFKKVDEEGQDYLVESSNNMYILDPNMEIVKTFGVEYDASQLSDAIIRVVKKASK